MWCNHPLPLWCILTFFIVHVSSLVAKTLVTFSLNKVSNVNVVVNLIKLLQVQFTGVATLYSFGP